MRITQMAQTMYAEQQVNNKLAFSAKKSDSLADPDSIRKAVAANTKAKDRESEGRQDQVELSETKESEKKPNAFTLGLYLRDGTYISQDDTIQKATELLTRALQNEEIKRAENLVQNAEIEKEMEKQGELFEAMSAPIFSLNGYAASASNLMNDRITVEITVSNEQDPCKPDRPPHHHGRIHDWHEKEHHHHPPHGGKNDGAEETITLTFVKSLSLQSGSEPENTLKINGESILMNEKSEAMVIMPDDTVRYVKLKQDILNQLT